MNTKQLFAGSIFAAALIVAGAGEARAHEGFIPRFAVTIDAGAVSVKEAGFGTGPRFAGGVFFRTGHRTALEIQVENYGVAIAEGAVEELGAGRMNMTTLLINEELYLVTHGRILPYGLAGIGFTLIGYTPDAPQRIQRDFVDRLALQLGGGVDIEIWRTFSLSARARYNLVKTWVEERPRTEPIRDTDPLAQNMLHLYGLELGFGVKVSF
jgi:opacity protein-like surface antigen